MSTEPRKPPPRIHKAPKRLKPKTTASKEKPTKKPVKDLADRPRLKPPLDLTQILELADGSDDETGKNDDDQPVVEILKEPDESAKAELSLYQHSMAIH